MFEYQSLGFLDSLQQRGASRDVDMNASHEVYVFECNVTQHGIHMDLVIKDILDKLAGSGIITPEKHQSLKHVIFCEDGENNGRASSSEFGAMLLEAFIEHMNYVNYMSASMLQLREDLKKEMNVRKRLNSQCEGQYDGTIYDVSSQVQRPRSDVQVITNLHIIEASSRVQGLLAKIQELENEHSVELERIKSQNFEKESDLKRMLASDMTRKNEVQETRINALEQQLRSEQIKRRSIQSKLINAEVESRKVVEDVENKNLQLQRRLEFLDIEHSRLKIEHHVSSEIEIQRSECGYDNNKVSYGNSNNVRL